jgi:Inner membrane component of T3SS, cytoplasmic domain
MTDAQGMRPDDPFRALQLHPEAPRDLIEDAYWLLVSARSPVLSEARIAGLNKAYATLCDADARQTYREQRGVQEHADPPAPRRRAPFLRLLPARKQSGGHAGHQQQSAEHGDLYRVLRVDPEADGAIIHLAYEFWTHGLQGARPDRDLIEKAYRTLSDPALRAQYDAQRQDAPPPEPVKITKEAPAQIHIQRHSDNQGATAVPSAVVDGAMTSVPDEPPTRSPVTRAEPRSATGAPVEAAATVVAPAGPPAAADVHSLYVEPADPRPQRPERPTAPAIAEIAAEPAPPPVAPHAPPPVRLPGGRQLAEAQHNRLLQLRNDAIAVAAPAVPASGPPEGPPAAAATLAFISGPRKGERLELAADTVMLGSSGTCDVVLEDSASAIDPVHAQLVPHGATYMFRDIARHDTTIAGSPPALPVVILEDGDEIQIGEHRMRFACPSEAHRPARMAGEAV